MQRRSFLAAGAALPVVAAAVAPAAAATPWHFDRAAFEAVLAKPYRHRQVFATTKLDGGAVLHYMENSVAAYADGFGEGPGTLHAAAVMYGTALTIACDDAAWEKYKIAPLLAAAPYNEKIDAAATKNPYASRVRTLAAGGAHFFVCNNALHGMTGVLAKASGLAAEAIHADLLGHLLDGAMLVPAGVAALNAAQEAKFTLVQATIG